jgi:hypothetical protein
MVMIEPYPCSSKLELEKQERIWMEKLKTTLNSHIPTRTNKEYRTDNRDELLEKMPKYWHQNKDEINRQRRLDRKENPEKYSERDRARSERRKEKVTCECGAIVVKRALLDHRRRKCHKEWEQKQQQE